MSNIGAVKGLFILLCAALPAACSSAGGVSPEAQASADGPAVEQSAIPEREPQWTEGNYFPTFPPAEHIYVIPVRTSIGIEFFPGSFDPAWRVNRDQNDMMALTLVGMQGLVNRQGGQIFLEWEEPWGYSSYWLEQIAAEVELEVLDLDGLEAVQFIMDEFGATFSGAVVYDPEIPDTINLATMIAGLENRVMVAPEQLEIDGFPEFDSVTDLRELAAEQGWQNDIESQTAIYQWVYDNLWPDLEHRMIGLISPGPTTSRIFEDDLYWPMEMASRDFYVALRVPALYLHPVNPPQADLLKTFIADAPSPIPILGGFAGNENGATELASSTGNWQAVLSWPGAPLSSGNLSALGGISSEPVAYEPIIRTEKILETLGDDPVAAIFSTDGDAIFYMLQHGFLETGAWDEVQGQNFGWTINPVMRDLAPVVWNHYVQERDTVGLVAGLSGGGYIFPHAMGEEQLNVYLENAERYMREAGLRVVHATLDDHNWNMALAAQFAEGLAGAGHLGSIVGYGGSPGRSQIEYFGQPVPSVWPSYVLGEENAEVIAEDLLARRGGVELIDVNDQYLSPGTASQPDEGSLNEAAALIPGSFATAESCCLAVAIPVSLQPGNHTLTFRMKVPAKNSGGGIANIYVGSQGDDWQNLAGQSVTVSDFSQTDVYQDFSFAFEVTEPITTGQIRLDYLNTTTALVVDTVRLVNEDSAIPVFALIRINWGNDVSRSPGQFAAGFEAGGGVLLTMEEFMAALNPEYMIELAQTMLASDDPLLLRAQEEFDRGEFAASLISVRRALGEAID